ncbi:phage tail protein [Acinetobacter brisouii]|uniref:phage tail protein n=1 Tax=Acinetobacter brisouii TaxID=396323 RepID=UPI00124D7CAF|nr:phage tail protein [Acinetobacter brisouii]
MTVSTFSWLPDLGSERTDEPLVTVTKFGDGYESRLAIGVNSQPMKWSVSFTCNITQLSAIKAFLIDKGAITAFHWTTPDGDSGMFVARSWKTKQIGFGVFQLTSTFEQVFE